jgi:hypothetical protein
MTIDKFKEKHSGLIARGVITIDCGMSTDYITIDRFDEQTGNFIATPGELKSPRGDVLKMGFSKLAFAIGVYYKRKN